MIAFPNDIISQWSDFVTSWCLGAVPAEPPVAVDRAFRTLRRLWPEYVYDLQAQDRRGLLTVAPAVSLGLTLAACEPLTGFDPVMARVRRGERSAQAELEFAAALVRSGFIPELEPEIASKKPDCLVKIGSEVVFAEVIAPEKSGAIGNEYAMVHRVVEELVARNRGTATEVLLAVDSAAHLDTIIDSVTATPPDDAVHYVEGVGSVQRSLLGPQ